MQLTARVLPGATSPTAAGRRKRLLPGVYILTQMPKSRWEFSGPAARFILSEAEVRTCQRKGDIVFYNSD